VCKQIIGEAREKFNSIAGPGGGTTLNGQQLKAEAKEDMAKLIDDLQKYVDGSQPYYWVQG
jgi:GTPase involved in cell partitioning and DNA repair